MNSAKESIRTIERKCGGWLALSDADPKIGVTAPTEDEALAKLEASLSQWRATLKEAREGRQ